MTHARPTLAALLLSGAMAAGTTAAGDRPVYPDGRPAATLRLEATDQGVVLKHGDGPGQCDVLGARDVWVYEAGGTYYMHYDGAGPKGWLASLATSTDLVHWTKDLDRWNTADKAVVLDGRNCRWSRKCIGLPSVVKVGERLAVLYDAPGGDSKSHMKRDVGLAWLSLPLTPPFAK